MLQQHGISLINRMVGTSGNVPVCASLVYKVKDLKAMKELRELSEANELNELLKDETWDLNRE